MLNLSLQLVQERYIVPVPVNPLLTAKEKNSKGKFCLCKLFFCFCMQPFEMEKEWHKERASIDFMCNLIKAFPHTHHTHMVV